MKNNIDEKFISYALNLSQKNLGQTSPNPVVGCVIVKNGNIISTGITSKNGRPHAEKNAIDKVNDKSLLKGATIYVTLEPCSHFGQTPPCVDEIIKYQFVKVVIATRDIDSRVNGQGITKLQKAGIEVVCGILEKEAREINRGFFKAKTSGMPFVTLKLASSLDGKIATKNFDSKWITSQNSRHFAHYLRAINDAVLVGANTVRKDDPSLDCRLLGLEDFSPKRVVITNMLGFDPKSKIFQNTTKVPTLILINSTKFNQEKQIFKSAGDDDIRSSDFANHHPELVSGSSENSNVKIIHCAEKNGRVDLVDALKKLHNEGVNSVLVEGGQKIATEFLRENLVDELVWIRNKKIIGDDGVSSIGKMNIFKITEALNDFYKTELREIGEDVVEIFRKFEQ